MSMSLKKKSGQKYQNTRKFKLDSESKLTRRCKATPLDHLCQRCYDQIKWKMDYKKYKPLTTPGKCVDCGRRNILKSYRALCDPCAIKKVEIRVPRAEAQKLGIIPMDEPEQEEETTDAADGETESKTVAEQVIQEEAVEEEEIKESEPQQPEESTAQADEEVKAESAAQAQAQTSDADEGDNADEGSDGDEQEEDGEDCEEKKEKKPKAVAIPVQTTLLNKDDPVIKATRCSKCTKPVTKYATQTKTREQIFEERQQENDRIFDIVSEAQPRLKRKIMRQLQNGEIDYDAKLDKLIYTNTKEEYNFGDDSGEDSEDI